MKVCLGDRPCNSYGTRGEMMGRLRFIVPLVLAMTYPASGDPAEY